MSILNYHIIYYYIYIFKNEFIFITKKKRKKMLRWKWTWSFGGKIRRRRLGEGIETEHWKYKKWVHLYIWKLFNKIIWNKIKIIIKKVGKLKFYLLILLPQAIRSFFFLIKKIIFVFIYNKRNVKNNCRISFEHWNLKFEFWPTSFQATTCTLHFCGFSIP